MIRAQVPYIEAHGVWFIHSPLFPFSLDAQTKNYYGSFKNEIGHADKCCEFFVGLGFNVLPELINIDC